MKRNRPAPPAATQEFSPLELVRELGLPDEAAHDFATAAVLLPVSFLTAWRGKIGPRELSPAQVAMITGKSKVTVYASLKEDALPRLRHRVTGQGAKFQPRIAPADLWNFLRAQSQLRGAPPAAPAETPTQTALRREREHAAALEACGASPNRTQKKTRTKERRHDQDRSGSLER